MNSAAYGVHSYEKERWVMEKARACGVPVPSVLAVTGTESHVYMILTHISGVSGIEYAGDRIHIWRQLGRYARVINSIKSEGLGGRLIDSCGDRFAQSWVQWVEEELRRLFKDDRFVRWGILSSRQVCQAKNKLETFLEWSFEPTLNHGNLSLENTIVDDCDALAIIDWGNAMSHRSPHFDLAEVCLWNKDLQVVEGFREGYGISHREFEDMKSEIAVLQLWRVLDCINWSLKVTGGEKSNKFVQYGIKKLPELLRTAELS